MTEESANHDIVIATLTGTLVVVLAWSFYHPAEQLTWWLESLPILVLIFGLALTYSRFVFTPLSYILMWMGCVLVLIGAHYTYAHMPLFEQFKTWFGFGRNHYDRFGHFFQGLIPALVFRELLLRTTPLRPGWWMKIIVIALCMAKSLMYELAEWIVSDSLGQSAHEFLGTQGDEWDAQKDMALATIGSIFGLWLFSSIQDRQLLKLHKR